MTEPRPTTEELLAARYGMRSDRHRRRVVAIVAVLAVVAVGLLLWIAWSNSNPAVQGELESYEVVSAHEVQVVIAIRRDDGDAVECVVQARASDHTLVGDESVTVPAGADGSVRYTASITTDREATSVTVSDCR